MTSFIADLWAGRIPLPRIFWNYGIVASLLINLAATALAMGLIAAGVPNFMALAVFILPIPWNILMVVGVWRSAGLYSGPASHAVAARLAITAWSVTLSLL
jgi:hypothetical protein